MICLFFAFFNAVVGWQRFSVRATLGNWVRLGRTERGELVSEGKIWRTSEEKQKQLSVKSSTNHEFYFVQNAKHKNNNDGKCS